MTWTAHSSVGVAQIVFYIPALLVAQYLLFFKHRRPILAWFALSTFSGVRIASGVLLILFSQNPDKTGYIVGALVLEGTGLLPLIETTIGLLRIIVHSDLEDTRSFKLLRHSSIAMRFVFFTGAGILVAGAVLTGHYDNASDVSTGYKLAKAGDVIIVVVVAWLAGYCAYFFTLRSQLSRALSQQVLIGMAASIPFLIVRLTYSCLAAFDTYHGDRRTLTWSPLYGSIAALVVMHSLMEYIVVIIYAATGLLIPPVRTKTVATPQIESRGAGLLTDIEQPREIKQGYEAPSKSSIKAAW